MVTDKELLCEKERKDVEIAAQTATLAEQRKHIEILDHALTNAQGNIVRLDEEARKKEFYVERVHELQRALQQMQAASERRLEMEKRMRTELEKDVQSLGRNLANSGGDAEDLRKTIRYFETRFIWVVYYVTLSVILRHLYLVHMKLSIRRGRGL